MRPGSHSLLSGTLRPTVAVGLSQQGVVEGDVVALVLPQTPQYVVAYVAASRLGAITAGVNTRLSSAERAAVLGIADPKIVIDSPEAVDALRVSGARPTVLDEDPDRPVAIVFTSGTTGTPKGAVFASRQLSFITQTDTGGTWGGGGTTFAATSFAHLGPMTKLPGSLMRGGTTHVLARWRASDALRMVDEHRMASIGGIPTQVALMLQEPDFDRYDVSCVKAIVLAIEPDHRRLSLGMKQLQPDVWDTFFQQHRVGDVVRGKVLRIAGFGAFVEVADGVEGLCHNSEATDQAGHPVKLEPGQEHDFKIIKMNPEEKKVGLSLRAVGEEASRADVEAYKQPVSSSTTTLGEIMNWKRAGNDQD